MEREMVVVEEFFFVQKADFPAGKQVELMQCTEGRGTFICTWKEGAS